MKPLTGYLCVFATIASLVGLAHHLGFDLWTCASCSLVDEQPISAFLSWLGPIALSLLSASIFLKKKWAVLLLGLFAVVSAGLVYWSFAHRTLCLTCLLTHVGVISAVLTLLPAGEVLALVAFSAAVIAISTGALEKFSVVKGVGIFRPREGERIPAGRVLVLFSDPECGRCKLLEARLSAKPSLTPLIYRWTLLPQSQYRSMRADALLEMVRSRSPKSFEALRRSIFAFGDTLSDEALIRLGEGVGLTDVTKWLDHPDEQVLIDLSNDQSTSTELQIDSLPALAELSEPDATGVRILRRVPLSYLEK